MTLKYFLLVLALSTSCRPSTDEASRSIIDGSWETACVAVADQSSLKVRYDFLVTNVVTRTQSLYADAACATPRGTVTHTGVFDLAVRPEVTIFDVDIRFREVFAIPANADGAAAWNAQTFCGLTRWLPLEDEEVTAQTDPNCGVYGTSLIEYRDLVEVDPESSLTFGSQLSHLLPRPTAVDATNPLNVFRAVSP